MASLKTKSKAIDVSDVKSRRKQVTERERETANDAERLMLFDRVIESRNSDSCS